MTLLNRKMCAESAAEKNVENKSKTPMWQVNQLARHHKIEPVYKLIKEENGKIKKFTMSLTLGNDTWTGSANTKKQAQQNAAKNALKNTKLTLPPAAKKKPCLNPKALTDTVRLNGWAMVHGKQVTYKLIEKKYPSSLYNSQQQRLLATPMLIHEYGIDYFYTNSTIHPYQSDNPFRLDNCYSGSYYSCRERPCRFMVRVEVGDKSFIGEGFSEQAARHNAAKSALDFLVNPKHNNSESSPKQSLAVDNCDKSSEKSSICVLHEEAMQRNMTAFFNTLNEQGPAHLRTYTVELVVGTFSGETLDETRQHFRAIATGKSKKLAKQMVSTQILEKLRTLPLEIKKTPKVIRGPKKKPPPSTETLHPVSRLMQICQAQKIKEPVYEIIDESVQKRGENKFSVKCSVNDKTVIGAGKSKKEAKKIAANLMLIELGKQPSPEHPVPNKNMVPTKSSLKNRDSDKNQSKPLQVKFSLSEPN